MAPVAETLEHVLESYSTPRLLKAGEPFHFIQDFLPFQFWNPSDPTSFAHQTRLFSQATYILPPGCFWFCQAQNLSLFFCPWLFNLVQT